MRHRDATHNRPKRPLRPRSHAVGDTAITTLQSAIPPLWILREVPPDYGIDCEIEVVSSDGEVSGALIKAQVKGASKVGKRSVSVPIQSVRYWLALPVPVILVRVVHHDVRWLDVRDYLLMRDRYDQVFRTSKRTVSFSFTQAPYLPRDASLLEELALEHQRDVETMREADVNRVRADNIGFILLVRKFDNDPDKWISWLREKGSLKQLESDLPFVAWVKGQAEEDPQFLKLVKEVVEEATA